MAKVMGYDPKLASKGHVHFHVKDCTSLGNMTKNTIYYTLWQQTIEDMKILNLY